MSRQFGTKVVALLTLLVFLLGACTPTAAPTPASPTAAATTAAPPPTDVPEEAPEEATEETPAESEPQRLILATTSSTYDSGLLDYILPDFEAAFNVRVEVVAVGTGQAMQLGQDGNADVLLVHDRAREDAFMDDGHGVRREDVMYNDFIIVGPSADAAGIKGMNKVTRAFETLAETESTFVSRGDDSGTHGKEKSIWAAAGIEPSGAWYVSAGQNMGAVLTMANEQEAYTLSDRATYLARTLEGIELEIVVEGDPLLFNPYGVIAIDPAKNPNIQADLAQQFIDWLISVPVQEKIGTFGVDAFGAPLFTPDSQPWRDEQAASAPALSGDFQITGAVAQALSWTEDELTAMDTLDVEGENSDGEAETYTGVAIKPLLEQAQPNADATTVVLVADDGYTAELPLADVMACDTCILQFRSQGGFTSRMPGFPKNTSVKGIVEIQVQ